MIEPPTSSAARHSARDLVASGLLDLDWISAQLGTLPESPEDAAMAVISTPDISPHPLFEATWLPGKGVWQAGDLPPSLWYVTEGPRSRLAPHPLINTERILEEHPAAREHAFGPLAWWAAHATRETPMPVRRTYPHLQWGEFRDSALRAAREWQVQTYLDANPGASQHVSDASGPMVTVLMSAQDVGPMLASTIAALQDQTLAQWELLVLDRGSIDATSTVATEAASSDPRVRVVLGSRTPVGRTLNRGLQRARGEFVTFVEPGHLWHPEFLARTVAVLRASGREAVQAFTGPDTRLSGELVTPDQFDLGTTLLRRRSLDAMGGFDEDDGDDVVERLVGRLRQSPSVSWAHPLVLVRSLATEAPTTVNWEAVQATPRVPGRASVVLPIGQGSRGTVDWLLAAQDDVEVVVVAARDRRGPHLLTSALADLLPAVTSISVPAGTRISAAMNIAIAHTTGDRVVLVRPEAQPSPGLVRQLSDAVADASVAVAQPLVLDRRGLILSAGATFPRNDGRLGLLLAGHPLSDARRVGRSRIPAPASPMVALRAETLLWLGGLDPAFGDVLGETDLGLRAAAAGIGSTLLVPDLTVTSRTSYAEPADLKMAMSALRSRRHTIPEDDTATLWHSAGFEVTGVRTERVSADEDDPDSEAVLLQQQVVRAIHGIDERPPRLRWTIDTAAPAGPRGERWGDTHFARSLAAALEAGGQHVSVDSRDARDRPSRDHDDVVLVLRGLDLVEPHATALNMQWIISHPDMVSMAELKGFDLVYAASLSWPAQVRREWGLPVEPLLQCTDPRYFHPDRGVPDTGPAVLFVGNSRGVFRQAVRTALSAEADLTVHGADWDEFLDPASVASSGVPNSQVGALYASAGVVLNDHHVDMRRDSFLSNRLFDAAACGARIATDPVSGLHETFGDLVQPFHDEDDLIRLTTPPYDAFPSDAERRAQALRIIEQHTFDQRAARLVADAVRALRLRERRPAR
ncbi:glycosyltransferase [Nocardioides piscis]|uniref:Glycosyltransferase n=1 Tax=Nocardioides piscis TaxID=2714938 RepID=A0A6G7YJR5_9ACTN|nr:glycosyltransferase [Nocardioides piscis]QIK76991.1 glycosyltransferase [Nocardioides piscis]